MVRTIKPGLHAQRPAIQTPRYTGAKRPETIAQAMARAGLMSRPPQSKAAQS